MENIISELQSKRDTLYNQLEQLSIDYNQKYKQYYESKEPESDEIQ